METEEIIMPTDEQTKALLAGLRLALSEKDKVEAEKVNFYS
jgi:hypothetical protein